MIVEVVLACFLFGFLCGKMSKLWWKLVWIEDHLENLKFYVRKSYEAEYLAKR